MLLAPSLCHPTSPGGGLLGLILYVIVANDLSVAGLLGASNVDYDDTLKVLRFLQLKSPLFLWLKLNAATS